MRDRMNISSSTSPRVIIGFETLVAKQARNQSIYGTSLPCTSTTQVPRGQLHVRRIRRKDTSLQKLFVGAFSP